MVFDTAIKALLASGASTSLPQGFAAYLKSNGIANKDTASYISVDSLKKLRPELKAVDLMVFRLGRIGKGGTAFGFAKSVNGWSDYFLCDEQLFTGLRTEVFVPTVPYSSLYSFMILPSMTETSLVNLALASGVISHLLGIGENTIPSVPATGQSTYSFDFRPHSAFSVVWSYFEGQVEMDGVFVCSIGGSPVVVVIESKSGLAFSSLAKHKLFYPVLALRTKVPAYMPIIPIYLRVVKQGRDLHFYFARCEIQSAPNMPPALNELVPIERRHVILTGLNIQQSAGSAVNDD